MRFCPQCGGRFPAGTQFCPHDGTATQPVDSPRTADPLVGQVIDDRYRVEGRIGQGGMGVVYRAKHVMLNKLLALKVLRSDMASEQESVQRFINEARSASSIGHPNIIDISDFGTLPNGSVYFAMEYVDGISLSDLIDDTGGLDAARAAHILTQIASALAAAHGKGITHRDLKPDNILVVNKGGDDSFVKVLDFGIAKVAGSRNKLTRTGMVFGTPDYMAPEQAAGDPVDARTDVYALGVIAYELCTGEVPFSADTFVGVVTKHMREAPKLPSSWNANFAQHMKAFEPLIMKALEKSPGKRHASMHAFIDALQDASRRAGIQRKAPVASGLAKTAAQERVILPDSTAPTPSVKIPIRGNRLARTALVVSAIGLAAVVPALMTSSDPTDADASTTPRATSNQDSTPAPTPSPVEVADQEPLVADAPIVYVEIRTEPAEVTVFSAGEAVGTTPFESIRPAGEDVAEFVLRRAGYRDHVVEVDSESPENIEVQLQRVAGNRIRRPVAPAPNASHMSDEPRGAMTSESSPSNSPSMSSTSMGSSLETLRGFDGK